MFSQQEDILDSSVILKKIGIRKEKLEANF
jgi:hypothetical protein